MCRTFLENFKKAELKNLGIQTQNGLQYNVFNQRWYELATDIILLQIRKKRRK